MPSPISPLEQFRTYCREASGCEVTFWTQTVKAFDLALTDDGRRGFSALERSIGDRS